MTDMTTLEAAIDKVRYEEIQIGDDLVFLGYAPGIIDPVARVDMRPSATDEEKNKAFKRLVDMVVDRIAANQDLPR